MRLVSFLVLVFGSVLVAGDSRDKAIEDDLKALRGTWGEVSVIADGKAEPEDRVKNWQVVFDGLLYTVKEGDKVRIRGTMKIDPTQKPKTIDLKPTEVEGGGKGETMLGIYEVHGDKYTLCFALPGKDRPASLTSTKGSGHILVVHKRLRP